ncbi:MAG: hypothetical protein KC800_16440 [Candidatus Eremiobacteraeota bacterium]|nr:hypothetical protein [Candidatus Eremiobacteraeota bacterium]
MSISKASRYVGAIMVTLLVILAPLEGRADQDESSSEWYNGDKPFYEHVRQFPISYWCFWMTAYRHELTPEFEIELELKLNEALSNRSSEDALDLATIWSLHRAFQRDDTEFLELHALSAWPDLYMDLTTTVHQRAGFYFGLSEYRLERLVGCSPAEVSLMRKLSLSSTQAWPMLVETHLSDLEPDFLYRLESIIDWDAENLLDERNWTIALVGDLIGAVQNRQTCFRQRLNRRLVPGTLRPVTMTPDPRTMAESDETRAFFPPKENVHRGMRVK